MGKHPPEFIIFLITVAAALSLPLLQSVDWCMDNSVTNAISLRLSSSCADYWINRYQALIGAIAALLAGILAFAGAYAQIGKMKKQIEIDRHNLSVNNFNFWQQRIIELDNVMVILRKFINLLTDTELFVVSLFMPLQRKELNRNSILTKYDLLDKYSIEMDAIFRQFQWHDFNNTMKSAIDNLIILDRFALLVKDIAAFVGSSLDMSPRRDMYIEERRDIYITVHQQATDASYRLQNLIHAEMAMCAAKRQKIDIWT